jgi:uncharacterized protein YoxC
MPTRPRSGDQPTDPAAKKTAARKPPAKKATAKKATAKKQTGKKAAGARVAPERPSPRGGLLPTNGGDTSSDVQIGKLETALEERTRERDDLSARLAAAEEKLDGLQKEQAAQTEELGRLRQVASTVDSLTQERDDLQQRVESLQVDLPARIEKQVAARVGDLSAAHAEELAAVQQDRDRLATRVTELETPKLETATSMSTAKLASHFAEVLSQVAEVPPSSPDAPYAASVTAFSVSAKGVLRATDTGDVELVTPDPGAVPADAMSTLHLDLKLLPRLGTPPPAG